jgi:hypothetical protein
LEVWVIKAFAFDVVLPEVLIETFYSEVDFLFGCFLEKVICQVNSILGNLVLHYHLVKQILAY